MRKNPVENASGRVALNQNVVNPVGNKDNTQGGPAKRNAPSQRNSGSKVLSQKVLSPVANKRNTSGK